MEGSLISYLKMANKDIINVFIAILFGFCLIISIPIPLISINLSSFSSIEESFSFNYFQSSPLINKNLYINADVGDVLIEYTYEPVNYYVKIDINFELSGANLKGKNYSDFFEITWQTAISSANLTLDLISDDWFNPSMWAKKKVDILVFIRADIVLDLITNIDKGNFEILVPWGVSIGSIVTNITNGAISYKFKYCTIEGNIYASINFGDFLCNLDHTINSGNITGFVNKGKFELTTLSIKFTQNSIWDFKLNQSDPYIYVYQYEDLGANITATLQIHDGSVFVQYDDNSANIGAMIKVPYGNNFMDKSGLPQCISSIYNITCTEVKGFDYQRINPESTEGIVFITSYDILTNKFENCINFIFEIKKGSFAMDLSSIPSS